MPRHRSTLLTVLTVIALCCLLALTVLSTIESTAVASASAADVASSPDAAGEDGAVTLLGEEDSPIVKEIYQMRMRQLKQFLTARGVTCDECKQDRIKYLEKALESKDYPIVDKVEL